MKDIKTTDEGDDSSATKHGKSTRVIQPFENSLKNDILIKWA